jgi:hypothetical protein
LQVLIAHLPQDAHVMRAVHGESAEWSLNDHLLAAAVDHLAVANWMFAAVNRDEDSEVAEYPTPIPRPGSVCEPEAPPTAEAATASPRELTAFFSS